MKRLLPCIIFIAHFFTFSHECRAQCGYPVSFTTSNNYCVGSTFGLGSTHALEKIVWYTDGNALKSAKAVQSLSTSGITVVGGQSSSAGDNQAVYCTGIFVDEAGNLYVADNNQEWAAGASSGVTVAGAGEGSYSGLGAS